MIASSLGVGQNDGDSVAVVSCRTDYMLSKPSYTVTSDVLSSSPGLSLGIDSVPNLRDLGGYKTRDGATITRGLLYRSNQLSLITPSDMKKLAELNLKNVYDLRTEAERTPLPDELPPGVNNVWVNVLADRNDAGPARLQDLIQNPKEANESLGGGQMEAKYEESYRKLVTLPSAKAGYRELYLAIGEQSNLPGLFHCTTGKDRTGWAAAALLTLLGVPKESVMEDYLRSNDYILPFYKKEIDAFVAAGGEKAIPPVIFSVKTEYLEAVFDEMDKMYGSIEKYFSEALGIDTVAQKALRDLYLAQE
jgi:protein-tyrosine phosphatase